MRCLSAIRLCAVFALILTIVFITVDAFQSLLRAYSLCSSTVYDLVVCVVFRQCFDTVGWATGMASGL